MGQEIINFLRSRGVPEDKIPRDIDEDRYVWKMDIDMEEIQLAKPMLPSRSNAAEIYAQKLAEYEAKSRLKKEEEAKEMGGKEEVMEDVKFEPGMSDFDLKGNAKTKEISIKEEPMDDANLDTRTSNFVKEEQIEEVKLEPARNFASTSKSTPPHAPMNALRINSSPDWSRMPISNLTQIASEARLRAGIEAGRAKITAEQEARYKACIAAAALQRQQNKQWMRHHGLKTMEEIKVLQELETERLNRETMTTHEIPVPVPKTKDFFERFATYPELTIEMAAHIRPKDLVSLYSISKPFHEVLNGHFTHTLKLAAETQAASSSVIFGYKTFPELLIDDPAGRSDHDGGEGIHQAPSLKWLQLVIHRDKVIRDILACLARQGHRLPKGTDRSLKKMWTLMDLDTNEDRLLIIGLKHWFTPQDLWNLQCFVIKLDMRFNDPIEGPGSDVLRILMLGQRGLTPLRDMLTRKRFRNHLEIFELIIRYDYEPPEEFAHIPLWGIEPDEFGLGHLEGWGEGEEHLMRPDELIIHEACRRQLGMKKHIMNMMIWGYVDPVTCKNTPPTAEEMYMSDDEEDMTDMARFVQKMDLQAVVEKNQKIDEVLGVGHHGIKTDIIFNGIHPAAAFWQVPDFVQNGMRSLGLGDKP